MSYTLRSGLNVPAVTIVDEAGRVIEKEQRRVFRIWFKTDAGPT